MVTSSLAQQAIQPAAVEARGAFEAAVREHQAMVYSVAYHFLQDRPAAEELAQEVFLELFRHWHEIQSREHRIFWLRKVASRRCIDHVRRRKLRAHVSLDEVSEPFTWMPATDPLLKRYIEQLLGKLEEMPRLIVILRYQEGLEPAEIAEMLEMPVATVKSHLQRSLALLRRKLSFALPEEKS
ncbi:MAG: RNA polymerase sigma factor [Acidobacteriia bacterium]|nr:RNA polymerase sigma factor [Terriglobia bacterium]